MLPSHPSRTAAPAAASERRILAVRLENHAGALNRVANLFSQRGFNLDSVTVSPTEDPTVSRMTLTTSGSARQMEQAIAQVHGLVDVLDVDDLTGAEHVERELCLVRVHYDASTRAEIVDLIGFYKGVVVDVRPETLVVELSGPVAKVNQFVAHMARFGITDVARSGRVAMRREIVYGD